MKNRKSIILFCLFYIILCGFTPNNFTDEERALHICNFIRQITWPSEEKTIIMGLLEPDKNLSRALGNLAVPQNLRGKKVKIFSLKNVDNLNKLHLLYVNINQYPDINIDSLMKVAESNKFLLITEGASFNQSMINFVIFEDNVHYEVNEGALKRAGFTYWAGLPYNSIKNAVDWQSLFKDTKVEFDNLVVDNERLKKETEVHKLNIAQQEKIIAKNVDEIDQKNCEIAVMNAEIEENHFHLTSLNNEIFIRKKELKEQNELIERRKILSAQKDKIIAEQDSINTQYVEQIDAKIEQINRLDRRITGFKETRTKLWIAIIVFSFLTTTIGVFGIIIFRNFKRTQHLTNLLQSQNAAIVKQRDQINNQNREMIDSIIYAHRIQKALLPTSRLLSGYVEMFIYYLPRDIVSGDFYWMSKKEDKLIIVAADCTGHGVPGAFMSILGVAFLNEIVNRESELFANEILNKLRKNVVRSLNPSGHDEYTKDGMDVALCVIDYPTMTLQYAGAYNPLILIRNNELIEIKADKMPVAYSDIHENKTFTNNFLQLMPNDCIYLFSDGYADQFGGFEDTTKKYSSKRLRKTLLDISQHHIDEQEKVIGKLYDQWKGKNEQTDDVLLIGMKPVFL
ncbi:MAG: YfiR/HmsC family protein [Marinilabiliaceae bacterium]|nr:YfiR/HmsC family protein [Marinilabiliaceae bacterium]